MLVDAGVSPKVLVHRLASLGAVLGPRDIHGIVATHHHGDHFAHAARLAAAFEAPIFMHRGIEAEQVVRTADARIYEVGRAFRVGDLTVDTVFVPHDAPQVAVRIDDGVAAIGVATDLGRINAALVGLLSTCDAALVEANHCPEMLAYGPYPERIRARIGGGLGHLSNPQTAELATKLVGSRLSRLWLGHLSNENNTPERALDVVGSAARRIDVEVLPTASALALEVRSARPYQLALFGAGR